MKLNQENQLKLVRKVTICGIWAKTYSLPAPAQQDKYNSVLKGPSHPNFQLEVCLLERVGCQHFSSDLCLHWSLIPGKFSPKVDALFPFIPHLWDVDSTVDLALLTALASAYGQEL